MIEANWEFHVAIAEKCGNPYILRSQWWPPNAQALLLDLHDRLPRQYVDEHGAIIAAIEGGDI